MNTEIIQRLIITYPFSLGAPNGGARMTREIARHIALAGCKVDLISIACDAPGSSGQRRRAPDDIQGFEFDEALTAAGVTVHRIAPNRFSRWLDSFEVERKVKALIAERPTDAMLSYFQEGARLPALCDRYDIPFGYICTWQSYRAVMSNDYSGWRRLYLNPVKRRTVASPMRSATICFATSRFTLDELVEVIKVRADRITICYLGVDDAFFSVPQERRAEPQRIIFFGRIVAAKGVEDALFACSQLSRHGITKWEFHLFGSGNHAWAAELATSAGIGDHVFVNGPIGDAELREQLAMADVAILPSQFEAFGLAFAEAQAAGVPVVAYRAGSVPEVVQDGQSGWLAPLGEKHHLANHLASALKDPNELWRRGTVARAHVQNHFTWSRTARTILGGLAAVKQKPWN